MLLPQDDGNIVLLQQIGNQPALAAAYDHYLKSELFGKIDGDEYLFDLVAMHEQLLLFAEESFYRFKVQVGLFVVRFLQPGPGFPERRPDLFYFTHRVFAGVAWS